jgi:hypothetical protein
LSSSRENSASIWERVVGPDRARKSVIASRSGEAAARVRAAFEARSEQLVGGPRELTGAVVTAAARQ